MKMRQRESAVCFVLFLQSVVALLSSPRASTSALRQQRILGSGVSAASPSFTRFYCRRCAETSVIASAPRVARHRPSGYRSCQIPIRASRAECRCSSKGGIHRVWGTQVIGRRRGFDTLRATLASSCPAVEGPSSGEGDEKNPTTAAAFLEVGANIINQREDPGRVGSAKGVVLKEQKGPAWTEIVWDETKGRFVGAKSLADETNTQRVKGAVGALQLLVRHWFVPEDVTPDYYHFTIWRMFQRFVAATVNVFGTQALLLALGIKSRRLGAAAAMSWVLKDALGKCGRILWASKMGRRFDSDAKRWRFRSSLLYAAGNGLEIITYIFPASFLILAAAANSFKQISMLTSSATRNTIYRSFARGENIGDITAKGEAQIAVVDLLGILSGIGLCTLVGTSRNSILVAYILLSMVDISAIYLEIRAVVFTVLNHERTHLLVRDYVACGSDPVAMAGVPAAVRSRNSSLSTMVALRLSDALPTPVSIAAAARSEEGVAVNGGRRGERAASTALRAAGDGNAEREGNPLQTVVEKEGTVLRSSPSTVSRRENIFMPSKLTTHTFKTWSKVGMGIEEVKDLLDVFGEERYMLAYTEGKPGGRWRKSKGGKRARGTASVILHKDATGIDIVKSMLAREYLIDELTLAGYSVAGTPPSSRLGKQSVINGSNTGVPLRNPSLLEDRGKETGSPGRRAGYQQPLKQKMPSKEELHRFMEAARRRANDGASGFFSALESLGWSTEKFMFGNIQSKVEWRKP